MDACPQTLPLPVTLSPFPDLEDLFASLETGWHTPAKASRLGTAERRQHTRFPTDTLAPDLRVTIPGAATSTVLNISAHGVLIETPHRLCPGRALDVFVRRDAERRSVRATVVRSLVHHVTADGIAYRAALRFDALITVPERSTMAAPQGVPAEAAVG